MTWTRRFGGLSLALALAAGPTLAVAQTAPDAAPPATITQSPAPAAPAPTAPAAPASPADATLIAQPGDPNDVDEVVLPEKPVLILSGTAKWDGGYQTLRDAFAKLRAEAAKDGLAIAGRPLTVFVDTTDDTFRYDAMLPIDRGTAATPTLSSGMRLGLTPSGKAWRFVHKAPYDDIDTTYETVTTYLDAKDIVAKDAFIEEYVTDFTDPTDPKAEVNIFVQPR